MCLIRWYKKECRVILDATVTLISQVYLKKGYFHNKSEKTSSLKMTRKCDKKYKGYSYFLPLVYDLIRTSLDLAMTL